MKRHIEHKHSHNCSDCRLSFPTEDALRVHVLKNHAKSGTFVCNICGNGFSSFYRLQRHKREEHRRIRKHYKAGPVDLSEIQSNSSLHQEMESVKHLLPRRKNRIAAKCGVQFPVLISQQSDLDALKERLEHVDLLENVTCHRPDTKWKHFSITNVTFFLYLMKNVPLGCRSINLPDRKLRNPTIKCLLSGSNYNPYHDNLCFFLALAFEL